MKEVEDSSVSLFITSPPYWNLKDYGNGLQIGHESYEEYVSRLSAVWSECYQKGKESSVLVVNVNSRRHNKAFYPIAFDIARSAGQWKLWDHLIWYVPNALPQPNHYRERLFDNKFESLLVFLKGNPDSYTCHKPRIPQKYKSIDPRSSKMNERGRCLGNVIRLPAYRPPTIKKGNYHVAAFPEALPSLFISTYTNEGDLVLDPFVGSGTTLKVCKNMNRRGVGYELNEANRDLIEARLNEEWNPIDWSSLDACV